MVTDSEAHHVASQLRSKRNNDRKRSLSSPKPLPLKRIKAQAELSDSDTETRRSALQSSLEVLSLLPSNSTYAKHRRKIIQRALDVLNAERYREFSDNMDHS